MRELATAQAGPEDWYANLLWFDGRKCLLVLHAGTLFPVFAADVRAAQLRPLGPWLAATIAGQLRAEQLPPDALCALDPTQVRVDKTASRHVIGVMNDMASYVEAVIDSATDDGATPSLGRQGVLAPAEVVAEAACSMREATTAGCET